MKTMAVMMTMTTMTPRGWRLTSTGSCKAYRGLMFLRRVRRLRKSRKVETVTGAKKGVTSPFTRRHAPYHHTRSGYSSATTPLSVRHRL